jgi:hypothetical protein
MGRSGYSAAAGMAAIAVMNPAIANMAVLLRTLRFSILLFLP